MYYIFQQPLPRNNKEAYEIKIQWIKENPRINKQKYISSILNLNKNTNIFQTKIKKQFIKNHC